MIIFDEIEETYTYLAGALKKLKLVYIHIVNHSSMGAPEVPESVLLRIRKAFEGNIIASGGLDKEKAESMLNADQAELVAFGRPFLANPDLIHRMKHDILLNDPDYGTFYTPGEKGYTDYSFATV